MGVSPSNSRTNLDKAIQRLAGSPVRSVEMRSVLAAAIVGQFLPGASPKAVGRCNCASGARGCG